MEIALVVLALTVLVLAVVSSRLIRRSETTPGADLVLREAEVPAIRPESRRQPLRLVAVGPEFALTLEDQPLMRLAPLRSEPSGEFAPMGATFAAWLGVLLDNPRVLEFLANERWVLARVPESIRHGGQWVTTVDGTRKAVTTAAGSRQFSEIANIVPGGATVGAAIALGPAIVGATASAFAFYSIERALRSIRKQLGSIDGRLANAEIGTIRGAQDFLQELSGWGTPNSWPQQLRFELAIRRAALDPVCFVRRSNVDHLVAEMVKKGERFVGLSENERRELTHETQILSVASMVRAQLDLATTMLLLDSDDAPFGLERLNQSSDRFVAEMQELGASFQGAIDGKVPRLLSPVAWRRAALTAPAIGALIDEIGVLTSTLSTTEAAEVLLSVEGGRVRAALPPPKSHNDPGSEERGG